MERTRTCVCVLRGLVLYYHGAGNKPLHSARTEKRRPVMKTMKRSGVTEQKW